MDNKIILYFYIPHVKAPYNNTILYVDEEYKLKIIFNDHGIFYKLDDNYVSTFVDTVLTMLCHENHDEVINYVVDYKTNRKYNGFPYETTEINVRNIINHLVLIMSDILMEDKWH